MSRRCRARVLVDVLGALQALGLGGALLAQDGRQDDVGAHLQELALPVLEHRLDEVAGAQVPDVADGGAAVVLLPVVVVAPAGHALPDQHDPEDGEHGQGQPVLPQQASHQRSPLLSRSPEHPASRRGRPPPRGRWPGRRPGATKPPAHQINRGSGAFVAPPRYPVPAGQLHPAPRLAGAAASPVCPPLPRTCAVRGSGHGSGPCSRCCWWWPSAPPSSGSGRTGSAAPPGAPAAPAWPAGAAGPRAGPPAVGALAARAAGGGPLRPRVGRVAPPRHGQDAPVDAPQGP